MCSARTKLACMGPVILASLALVFEAHAVDAQPAGDSNSILILGSSVKGGASSMEATLAAGLGYSVEIASDAEWAAKTTADFATYKAIILGDLNCEAADALAAAEATRGVWGPAVTGNVILVGAHPGFNGRSKRGAESLASSAIRFAADATTTGSYVSVGCYFDAAPPGTAVKLLEPFGSFAAFGQEGCPEDAHIVVTHPALAALTDADLSGWRRGRGGCDTETGFSTWPSSFEVVAISRDTPSTFVGPDESTGSPYILARGESLVGVLCGDGVMNPTEQCDDGNNFGGDGCSASCRVEIAESETTSALTVSPLSPATASTTLDFSGNASVQSGGGAARTAGVIPGDDELGARVNVDVTASWSPTATIQHEFSPSLLRQGETLNLVNTLTGGPGPLNITYSLRGDAGLYDQDTFPADASRSHTIDFNFSATGTGTCDLKLDGDGVYSCSATKTFDIFDGEFPVAGLAGICVKITVPITTTLSVTPDGVVTVRSVIVDGPIVAGPDTLVFHGPSPSVLADPVTMACTAPVGAEAVYELASTETDPTAVATTAVKLGAKVEILVVVFGCTADIFDDTFTIATFGPGDPTTIPLTAPTKTVALGTVLPDNQPPVVNPNGPYSGSEGTGIQFFSAGTTDNCETSLDFVWQFSDGGIAFGSSPFHTFADNGIYSGRLVATDLAGHSGARSFSIIVENESPVPNAGPDTSAAWGVPVAFNGSAVDPGAADQPTLHYEWAFGDGMPSATGGPSVTHAYSSPGSYVATLTVCDKDGACTSDARLTLVRRRAAILGYLGDHSGVFDTPTSLSAFLLDEFGTSVPGRSISFTIGPETAGSSSTNLSGIAVKSHLVGLEAGSYIVSADFAGDVLYNGASDSAAYTVSQKATSVVYTGPLRGRRNKTITLSAVLKDSSGTPLAGRLITFQLGSQSVSAITNSFGVAARNLKLMQKRGTYPLTATFTPAGADATRYLGSAAAATFTLQARADDD